MFKAEKFLFYRFLLYTEQRRDWKTFAWQIKCTQSAILWLQLFGVISVQSSFSFFFGWWHDSDSYVCEIFLPFFLLSYEKYNRIEKGNHTRWHLNQREMLPSPSATQRRQRCRSTKQPKRVKQMSSAWLPRKHQCRSLYRDQCARRNKYRRVQKSILGMKIVFVSFTSTESAFCKNNCLKSGKITSLDIS